MATRKCASRQGGANLVNLSDMQLFNALVRSVGSDASSALKDVAWEIIRRFSDSLADTEPAPQKNYEAILGEARWGDAKRVESIFGLKRGVLNRLREQKSIASVALEDEVGEEGLPKSARAKRLYDLISIAGYLEKLAGDGV